MVSLFNTITEDQMTHPRTVSYLCKERFRRSSIKRIAWSDGDIFPLVRYR